MTQQLGKLEEMIFGFSSFDTSPLLLGTFSKKLQFVVLNRTLAIRKRASLNCRARTFFKTRIIQWGWENSAQNTSLSREKSNMMVSKCYLYQMSEAIYLIIHSFECHHSFLSWFPVLECHCHLLSLAEAHWKKILHVWYI